MKTWTKPEQLAAYKQAQAILAGEKFERVRKERREEAAQEAFVRWLAESDGAPIDVWVSRAVAAAGREGKKRKAEVEFTDEAYAAALSVSHTLEEWIDAKREFRATLPKAPATVEVRFTGELQALEAADLDPERLQAEIKALAGRLQLASRANPKDEELRRKASVLFAVGQKAFDVASIAGKTSAWAAANNVGSRTRAQEADALIRVVQSRAPERVVRMLAVLPLLSVDTSLPAGGWSDEQRASITEAVATSLASTLSEPPAAVAKAVLMALGCSPRKAKELDAHLRARERRA